MAIAERDTFKEWKNNLILCFIKRKKVLLLQDPKDLLPASILHRSDGLRVITFADHAPERDDQTLPMCGPYKIFYWHI